jgi:biopolymer transport protein ExbD
MRTLPHLRRGAVSFNMTPMIDVVFLLIIFFLVSSHLAKQETQMELDLPIADSSTKPGGQETPRMTINVLDDGSLLLAGRRVRPGDLQQRFREKLAGAGEHLEVRIRSDRGVAYRDVEPVLLACARAGIWNVTFAVYRSEDVR